MRLIALMFLTLCLSAGCYSPREGNRLFHPPDMEESTSNPVPPIAHFPNETGIIWMLLDKDNNDELSANEISNASMEFHKLDLNQDGVLTRTELIDAEVK
ncbi:hypothetical protein AB1K70_03315 [Bremerella sp. JC770]|uniref:hypothetical protein n=1 Tax=Bremerella sp. JC770 TaxID=3232137 RepID=UPI0034576178